MPRNPCQWRWLLVAAGCAALLACAPAATPPTAPAGPSGASRTTLEAVAPSRLIGATSLIGLWQAHSFTLTIDATGAARAAWRTNRWCGPGAPPPCDDMIGNWITPGGRATLRLDIPADVWTDASVLESTDPASLPLGHVRLQLMPDDQLRLYLGSTGTQLLRVNLCRARSARTTECGA